MQPAQLCQLLSGLRAEVRVADRRQGCDPRRQSVEGDLGVIEHHLKLHGVRQRLGVVVLGDLAPAGHAGDRARRPAQSLLDLFAGALGRPAAPALEVLQLAVADDAVVAEVADGVAELFAARCHRRAGPRNVRAALRIGVDGGLVRGQGLAALSTSARDGIPWVAIMVPASGSMNENLTAIPSA